LRYRAIQMFLPAPFLLAGGLLLLVDPGTPDVQVVQNYPTTTHVEPTTTTAGTTTTVETTIPGTNPVTVPTSVVPTSIVPTTIERKVTICHLPPGNPPNFQIIEIGESALAAHLAHGDIFPVPNGGVCFTPVTTVPATTTTVDQCPPELEPCTPGQQTTIPGTTTTIPGTTTTSSTTSVPSTTSTSPSSTLPSTTTTVPGVTTTVPLTSDSFNIGAADSVCSNDVPFIELTFGNEPEFNGLVGTVTFTTLDGDFIETIPITFEANTTIRVVFPGASFDPVTGEATDWPGWELNDDGFWVPDPTDAEFRDGIVITASLPIPIGGLGQSLPRQVPGSTITASTVVSYPPATALCNSPDGPFPPGGFVPNTPSGRLPDTGNPVAILLLVTGILVGLGNAAIQLGRKKTV
jgi:hypothetical protein